MQLLSGIGVAASHSMVHHHQAQHPGSHGAAEGPAAGVALSLSGAVQGTYRTSGGGTRAVFAGRGAVSPFGNARLQGTITLSSSASGGRLTLSFGKSGKFFAAVSGSTPSGTYTYNVTGGTRQFAGDTGSGSAIVQILTTVGARPHGRFLLSFQPAPSI
jgi:hypothetical protein